MNIDLTNKSVKELIYIIHHGDVFDDEYINEALALLRDLTGRRYKKKILHGIDLSCFTSKQLCHIISHPWRYSKEWVEEAELLVEGTMGLEAADFILNKENKND